MNEKNKASKIIKDGKKTYVINSKISLFANKNLERVLISLMLRELEKSRNSSFSYGYICKTSLKNGII